MDTISKTKNKVFYPESDGQPMGETDYHINVLIYLREALQDYFRDEPQIYIGSDMFIYYEEGNPAAVVAPDVFVVPGVSAHYRRIYKLWEEGRPPAVIFEITSKSSRLDDLGSKRALYAMWGVSEYYLFDPEGDYLEPRLWAYRLEADQPVPDYTRVMDSVIHSPILGLDLFVEGDLLRLRDPDTGEKLLSSQEARAARRAEAEARRAEAEARRAAEEEAARLRAELEQLKQSRKGPQNE